MSKGKNKIIGILSFLTVIFLLFSACNQTGSSAKGKQKQQQNLERLTQKAHRSVEIQPDSAILFADSAIGLMQKLHLKNSDTLFSLYEIKSTAFSTKGKADSALILLANLRSETIDDGDTALLAKIALLAGTIALNNKKNEEAEKYFLESISLLERQNLKDLLAQAYNNYGNLLYNKSENNKSLEYLLKAYKILDSLNNSPELCTVCLSISNIFNAIGSRDEELRYSLLGLKAALISNDKACEISIFNNLGVYYRHQNPDSARYYYQRIIVRSTPGNSDQVLSARYNVANLYFDQKHYNEALLVYNEILEQCLAEKIYIGVASAYSGIASGNNRMGNYGKAIEICKIALLYADSTGDKALVNRLKNNLHIYYKNNGDFKDAYSTMIEIKAFNDSTQALEKKVALHKLEIQYQTEKKEAENERLRVEVESQKQISKSRAYIISLLIVIALLSIFFSWKGYNLYRERSHAYNVLMTQYTDEKAQRELVGSLVQPNESLIKTISTPLNTDPIIEQLIQYYRTEKPYLDPKLRAEDVATKLNTSQKAITAALKQNNNSNFNIFTNQYRIEEAKRIMENLSDSFYKIESVAYDSGFGAKSSFYVAFEQFTGVKPSYYRSFMLGRKAEAS